MEQKTIRYKDLSGWLKAAVVAIWIIVGLWVLTFMVGFVIGIVGQVGY